MKRAVAVNDQTWLKPRGIPASTKGFGAASGLKEQGAGNEKSEISNLKFEILNLP